MKCFLHFKQNTKTDNRFLSINPRYIWTALSFIFNLNHFPSKRSSIFTLRVEVVDVLHGDDSVGLGVDVFRVEHAEVGGQLLRGHLVMQPLVAELETIGHVVAQGVRHGDQKHNVTKHFRPND